MSDVETDVKNKIQVQQQYVALCSMNQCTRGQTPYLIVYLGDDEGVANTRAEEHRNAHRDHEKHVNQVLEQARKTSPDVRDAVDLSKEEAQLLGTYVKGPRIWDAAELLPVVHSLQDKGLIEPGDNGTYRITDAGRRYT